MSTEAWHDELAELERYRELVPSLLTSLEAIVARVCDDFEHPSLVAYGSLDASMDADVLQIASMALLNGGRF
jgi:hypothetical protein